MADWTIEQMREAVAGGGAFVVGGTLDAVCDYLEEVSITEYGEQVVPEPEGVLVDAQTANVIVLVYDALSAENREKFAQLPVERAATVAWTLAKYGPSTRV